MILNEFQRNGKISVVSFFFEQEAKQANISNECRCTVTLRALIILHINKGIYSYIARTPKSEDRSRGSMVSVPKLN